jgi:hypothetical protein
VDLQQQLAKSEGRASYLLAFEGKKRMGKNKIRSIYPKRPKKKKIRQSHDINPCFLERPFIMFK